MASRRACGAPGRDAAAGGRGSAPTRRTPGPSSLSGVYGTGKSTTAVELADRLEAAGVPSAGDRPRLAGLVLGAPVDWDEHEDPRIGNANLAAMRANYLEVGVRSFVLAGTVRERGASWIGIRAGARDAARRGAPRRAAGR